MGFPVRHYLVERTTVGAAQARFEYRELLQQFPEVEKLPADDKTLEKSFLRAFLFHRKVEGVAAGG